MAAIVKKAPAVNDTNCHRNAKSCRKKDLTRFTSGAGNLAKKASQVCTRRVHAVDSGDDASLSDDDDDDASLSLSLLLSSLAARNDMKRRRLPALEEDEELLLLLRRRFPHFRTLPMQSNQTTIIETR